MAPFFFLCALRLSLPRKIPEKKANHHQGHAHNQLIPVISLRDSHFDGRLSTIRRRFEVTPTKFINGYLPSPNLPWIHEVKASADLEVR